MFERPRAARLAFVFTIRHGRRRFVLPLESVRVRRWFVQRRSRGIVSEILHKRESESAHAAQRSARVSLGEQNMKTERYCRASVVLQKPFTHVLFERFALQSFLSFSSRAQSSSSRRFCQFYVTSKCAANRHHKAKAYFVSSLFSHKLHNQFSPCTLEQQREMIPTTSSSTTARYSSHHCYCY